MASDFLIREGLNTRQMAEVAEKYRNQFDIAHVELVNIVEIIEFKLPEIFPGFELVIRPDRSMTDFAISEPHNKRMIVKESIYDGACEGDAFCRFTLAHELGHYFLHASKNKALHKSPERYDSTVSNMNSIESAEKQADMFARHFLAPPKLAKKYKDDYRLLSSKAGIPADVAAGSIKLLRRPELWELANRII